MCRNSHEYCAKNIGKSLNSHEVVEQAPLWPVRLLGQISFYSFFLEIQPKEYTKMSLVVGYYYVM